jgi:hypothetical protein
MVLKAELAIASKSIQGDGGVFIKAEGGSIPL